MYLIGTSAPQHFLLGLIKEFNIFVYVVVLALRDHMRRHAAGAAAHAAHGVVQRALRCTWGIRRFAFGSLGIRHRAAASLRRRGRVLAVSAHAQAEACVAIRGTRRRRACAAQCTGLVAVRVGAAVGRGCSRPAGATSQHTVARLQIGVPLVKLALHGRAALLDHLQKLKKRIVM